MTVHLYLSVIPEALIASMLSPEEFGTYYAVGGKRLASGEAIFFELEPDFTDEFFRIEEGLRRCVPHEDGTPKASVYISIYRALEHVPLRVIKKLHLVTQDGRTLGLDASDQLPEEQGGLHLYHEIAPVRARVVSTWGPRGFFELLVKNPSGPVALPAICFTELRLGDLAADPVGGDVRDLPYRNVDHLRDCLIEVQTKTVYTKLVSRSGPETFPYRTIQNGLFLGSRQDESLLYFELPPWDQLRVDHYRWWRSAHI